MRPTMLTLSGAERSRYWKMNEKIECMNAYFEVQIDRCAQRERALLADGRADEASFEKVRANIFDVFRTVLAAAEKRGGEEAAVTDFFLEKAERIPESWISSCAQAEAHGDAVKAHLEHIKLDTLREIKAQFAAVWGSAQ